MSGSSGGRPGPALTIGIPLILLGTAGYFGYEKVIKPALEDKAEEETAETLAASTSTKKYGTMINVAGDPWSGYSTFRDEPKLAAALAKDDIGINYIDDEKLYDQSERMKALAAGKIDVALTTVDAFLQHGVKHKVKDLYPGVILWGIDESAGGDAVFVSKDKASFDDVKPGDSVCYAAGTPSEHLWDFASLSFSSLGDSLKADPGVVAEDCWKKLKEGKVQVAVLWQPFTAIAEKEGYKKVFATGGQADDVIVDVLVANRQYVIDNKPTLQKLADAYFKTIDTYEKVPADHAAFITKDCGPDCKDDNELGKAVLSGIDFLTFEENVCLWFGGCDSAAKMPVRIRKTGRLLSAKDKIGTNDVPKAASIINNTFLMSRKDKLHEKAKLAAEVAGDKTKIAAPDIKAEEKTYEYHADDSKEDSASDVGTLKLPSIYFAEGSATVDPNAASVIKGIAEKLESFPALCIRVYGHTNSRGNAVRNKTLSDRRAHAIVDRLKEMNTEAFPASRFDVQGFGSEKPILVGGQEDLQASRRTEFRLFNCGN